MEEYKDSIIIAAGDMFTVQHGRKLIEALYVTDILIR